MPTSNLTHEQMHEIIDRGEGFLHDGRVITLREHIPAPETLAQTTTQKRHIADALDAEIDALRRRRAALDTEGSAVEQDGAIAAQEGRHRYSGPSMIADEAPAAAQTEEPVQTEQQAAEQVLSPAPKEEETLSGGESTDVAPPVTDAPAADTFEGETTNGKSKK